MRAASPRPGGLAWLLRHELRLAWRSISWRRADRKAGAGGGGPSGRLLLVLAVALVALVAFVGVPLGAVATRLPREPSPVMALLLDGAMLGVFALMLSQTLSASVNALFVRGDLDLLLSSPADGRHVLAARAVAIAMPPFATWGALALAVVGPAALLGRPQWLAVLPLLLSLALLATAAGLGLALGLFALIGPRATRTVGQVLAAVIGAAFFLLGQSRRLAGGGQASLVRAAMAWATPARLGPSSPLGWPARAAFGAPLPLLAMVAVAAFVFALTLAALGRRFVRDAAVGAGVGEGAPKPDRRRRPPRFTASPLRATVAKELRLLRHDPALISQVGLRVVFLLPLLFVLVTSARFGEGAALGSGVALVSVVAAQVAGSLAWITVSAEDAPDLLLSSPLGGERARGAKLLAALLPLVVIMAGPLLALLVLAPWAGVVATVGVTASSASAALVNLWFEAPASRSTFRRRGGSIVTALAEIVLGLGWGVACGLAVARTAWALLPVAVSLLLILVFWSARRPAQSY